MDEEKQMTIDTMRQQLEMEKQRRSEMAWMEIEKILQNYRCSILTQATFSQDGRLIQRINIVALD